MTSDLTDIAQKVYEPDDRLVTTLSETEGDLVVLGAGGKMGVSLARMAAEAFAKLPDTRRVYAVSRFSDDVARAELDDAGVITVACDLEDEAALAGLPDARNVVFMVGRKFGTSDDSAATWATNAYLPGRIVQRYAGSRIVAFSSGNVYPFTPVVSGGADEAIAPEPIGEYAQSCLGRERVLAYHASKTNSPLAIIRLNYAVDCRYGVLTDIATAVRDGVPVNVSSGAVNVVWQGDANRYTLSALAYADMPPFVLNVTGPETASVRWLAHRFGERLGRTPNFTGQEESTALLSNAARCFGMFGYPHVSLDEMIEWTVTWLEQGGRLLNKPTHFTERAGRF
jgi:nucleoside-diphosphate-sugar epimerase